MKHDVEISLCEMRFGVGICRAGACCFGVQGLGFEVLGFGPMVQGWGVGSRAWGVGIGERLPADFGFWVWCLGCWVQILGGWCL